MASFNALIRHYTIPELKKELEKMASLIYDGEQKCTQIKHEAEVRSCYLQRELQLRGVEIRV